MSAEMMPWEPASAPVAPDPAPLVPVAIPPHVVAAIASAAVEAYVQAQRELKRLEAHAYYVANRDRMLAQQREYRKRKKLERARHRLR